MFTREERKALQSALHMARSDNRISDERCSELVALIDREAFQPTDPIADQLARKDEVIEHQRKLLVSADSRIKELSEQKDGAYHERDRCVAAIARLATVLGWPVGLGRHEAGTDWDVDWMNIVFIQLPTGQVSWHIHDRELELFFYLKPFPASWDGHSTGLKYKRLEDLNHFWGPSAEVFHAVEAELARDRKPASDRTSMAAVTTSDELLDATINQLNAALRPGDPAEPTHIELLVPLHILAMVLRETRAELREHGSALGTAAQPFDSEDMKTIREVVDRLKPPTDPATPASATAATVAEANRLITEAGKKFVAAYLVADGVWRSSITNDERAEMRRVLRSARKLVMRGDSIR